MSAVEGSASRRVVRTIRSSSRPTARAKATGVLRRLAVAQQAEGQVDLLGPRLGRRVVERDHEIALRRGAQAALHHGPGLEVVGQRDGAEIMPERRAEPGGGGLHGGDAGNHGDVEGAPGGVAGLDRLEHRGGHGEDAGIAAGDDRDAAAARGHGQGIAGAGELDAVVAAVAALAGARGDAVEIGLVADEVGCGVQRGGRLGGDPFGRAGAEADDGEGAGHGAAGGLRWSGVENRGRCLFRTPLFSTQSSQSGALSAHRWNYTGLRCVWRIGVLAYPVMAEGGPPCPPLYAHAKAWIPTCVGMTGRQTWAPENQLCALCAPLCELCVETRISWAHLRRRFARCEDNLMTEPHRHGRRPWPGIRISEKYGAVALRLVGQRHHDLIRHRAALDVDRPVQQPGLLHRRRGPCRSCGPAS